ncbi:hypothetical protein ES703_15545 [subsurface metagenome]
MNRIFGLIMWSVPKEVAFQGGTLIISKTSNKCGEFFQTQPKYFFTL